MRIAVTGATGVIGRRAVPLLLEAGHQVTAIVRTPERGKQLERVGAKTFAANLFDADQIRRALSEHEVVINLATHVPASSF